MEDEGFYTNSHPSEYKLSYGEYNVLSETVPVKQIVFDGDDYSLLGPDDKEIVKLGRNTELEAKEVESTILRRENKDKNKKAETIINFNEGTHCRLIEPMHGYVGIHSYDYILVCGQKLDILMNEGDFNSERESRQF